MSVSAVDQDKLPALIIFDKDGTLIDFQSTWTPWITALAQSLEADCNFDVSSRLYDIMGYCNKTETLSDSSLLAYAGMDIIKEKLKSMLLENGVDGNAVDSLLRKCWKECHVNNTSRPVPTTDLPNLFGNLQKAGVKVAVCTSDSRESTESALRKLHVREFVDVIVCSDDENMQPKPSPQGVLKICTDLGVDLSYTIVVGDTTTDMLMAKSAGVGLIVGVLTGIGTKNELSNYTDVILDNVERIWTLFT
jgi:choline dehydrogenase